MKNTLLKDFLKVASISAILLSGASPQALNASNDFIEEHASHFSSNMVSTPEDERVGAFIVTDIVFAAHCSDISYHSSKPENSEYMANFEYAGIKRENMHCLKPLKEKVSWNETIFENQDTAFFIEKNDGTAVVSFKGSDRLQTWFSDFDAQMSNHEDGGRYHSGFLKMYTELESALFNQLMHFAEKNNNTIAEALEKTTFVGHSRGGGAAHVAADIVRRKLGTPAVKVITFGAPRALHKRTAGEYNDAAKDLTLNIAQDYDPVHYAAFSFLNGGAHVGNKVYIRCNQIFHLHKIEGYIEVLEEIWSGNQERGRKFEVYQENRDLKNETDYSLQAYAESAGNALWGFLEAVGG